MRKEPFMRVSGEPSHENPKPTGRVDPRVALALAWSSAALAGVLTGDWHAGLTVFSEVMTLFTMATRPR